VESDFLENVSKVSLNRFTLILTDVQVASVEVVGDGTSCVPEEPSRALVAVKVLVVLFVLSAPPFEVVEFRRLFSRNAKNPATGEGAGVDFFFCGFKKIKKIKPNHLVFFFFFFGFFYFFMLGGFLFWIFCPKGFNFFL